MPQPAARARPRRRVRILVIVLAAALGITLFVQYLLPGPLSEWYARRKAALQESLRREAAAEARAYEADVRARIHEHPVILNPPAVGGDGRLEITAIAWEPGPAQPIAQPVDVVELTADGRADAARINAAIAEAKPPGEILLREGVYRIEEPIRMRSGVVLRGTGMRKTILHSHSETGAVLFEGAEAGAPRAITSGYKAGSKALHVATLDGFEPGMLGRITFDPPEKVFSHPTGAFQQIVRIREVGEDGTLRIATPLRFVSGADAQPLIQPVAPLREAGIEALSIETAPGLGRAGHTVTLRYARDCFVRNCELSMAYFSHLWADRSCNLLVEGNYVHHAWGYRKSSPTGFGYGVVLLGGTADCLVTDNALDTLRHALMAEAGACANVFSFNASYGVNPQGDREGSADFSAHGGYPYMTLVEGNVLHFPHSADFWRPAGPLQTFFRNRIVGKGIVIGLDSHLAVVAGNDIVRGGVYEEMGTVGTVILANRQRNPAPPPKVIHMGLQHLLIEQPQEPDARLIPSLYLDEKPALLGDATWPCFGPDVADPAPLPAEERYETTYRHWPERVLTAEPSAADRNAPPDS